MRIRKTKSVNEKPWLLLVCGAFACERRSSASWCAWGLILFAVTEFFGIGS
jgi:hypothetical protein